jgi:hypothetical protein
MESRVDATMSIIQILNDPISREEFVYIIKFNYKDNTFIYFSGSSLIQSRRSSMSKSQNETNRSQRNSYMGLKELTQTETPKSR